MDQTRRVVVLVCLIYCQLDFVVRQQNIVNYVIEEVGQRDSHQCFPYDSYACDLRRRVSPLVDKRINRLLELIAEDEYNQTKRESKAQLDEIARDNHRNHDWQRVRKR